MHASAFVLVLCLVGARWRDQRSASPAQAADEQPAYGPELQGFEYPWPVSYFSFTSQGEKLRMAYMDVKPAGTPNGKTVVLFHGKNFCAATWQGTIAALTAAGYRVIAVDQIGFCKSSKPAHYQFSFQQLAGNTHALLASLGIVTRDHHRAFDRRHARHALRADLCRRRRAACAGQSDRPRGLEGKGRAVAKRRRLVSAGAENDRRQHPRLSARDLLCRHLGCQIRALGADAGRTLSRSRTRHRCLERGADRRHGLYAAGLLRVRENLRAGFALDRRQGHDCDRQKSRFAGGPRDARQLSGCWRRKPPHVFRMRS